MATSVYGADLPGDFDEDQASVDRRRAQLIAAMRTPVGGAGSGWAGGIANFLQNAVGTNLISGQDDLSKQIAQRRAAAADEALTKYGQLDKPAVAAQVGTGPIAPPPGTPGVEPPVNASTPMNTPEPGPNAPPEAFSATQGVPETPAGWIGAGGGGMVPQGAEFTPNKAGSPMIPGSMSDKLKLLSRVAQGGPMYAKMVEKEMGRIIEAPEKEAARKAAAEDRAALAREAQAAREFENDKNRAAQEYLKTLTLNQQQQFKEMSQSQQEYMVRLAAALKPDKGGGEGGTVVNEGTSLRGNPVMRNNKGTSFVEMVEGVPVPYTGKIIKPGEEKTVNAAMNANAQMEYTRDLAKRASDPKNKGAFDWAANVGGVLSNKTEGFISPDVLKTMSPEHNALRAETNRNFADLIHQMYGSAYTTGEQARGGSYTVLSGDSAKRVAEKLNAQVKFLEEMDKKYGDKIRGAAAARQSGGDRPPISGL